MQLCIGVASCLIFLIEWSQGPSCFDIYTSDLRRWVFALAEYVCSFLIGIFMLTHIEDLRQEDASRRFEADVKKEDKENREAGDDLNPGMRPPLVRRRRASDCQIVGMCVQCLRRASL